VQKNFRYSELAGVARALGVTVSQLGVVEDDDVAAVESDPQIAGRAKFVQSYREAFGDDSIRAAIIAVDSAAHSGRSHTAQAWFDLYRESLFSAASARKGKRIAYEDTGDE
jgi:hypothetical protein